MKTKFLRLVLVSFCLLSLGTGVLSAQESSSPGDEEGDPDQRQVPIDGGLALLLAAGAGYGLKKYRSAANRQKAAKESDEQR